LRCPYEGKVDKVSNLEEAQSAAGEILVLEERKKRQTVLLKEFCEKHGAVDVNRVRFAYSPSPTRSYDVVKLIEWLNEFGHGVPGYLNANGVRLKRHDEELEALQVLIKGKKTGFGHKKLKEEG